MNSKHLTLAIGAILCLILLGLGVTREVPVGRVEGVVTMSENGRPLRDVQVWISSFGPSDEESIHYGTTTDKDGHFRTRVVPVGTYEIAVHAAHHRISKHTVWVQEGTPNLERLVAEPSEIELSASISQRVALPTESPEVTISGFTLAKKLDVSVWRLRDTALIGSSGPAEAMRKAANDGPEKVGSLERKLQFEPKARDYEGAFTDRLKLDPLPEGIYYIKVSGDTAKASVGVYATNIAMVTKSSPGAVDCYVTDIAKGTPVVGATVFGAQNGLLSPVGETNASGLLHLDGSFAKRATFVAKVGKSWASTDFFGDPQADDGGTIAVITDRSIYRPGDLVQFKAIVRRRVGNELTLPSPGQVKVEVLDTDEESIHDSSPALSPHGTITGSFRTSKEAKPGLYQIHCTYNGIEEHHYVSIVAYRKPEFVIKVKPAQKHFVFGQNVVYNIDLSYYFGGPVVGAKIHAFISRNPIWDSGDYDDYGDEADMYQADSPWRQSRFGGYGEYSSQNELISDEKGHATVSFPTRQENDPESLEQDYTYTVSIYGSESESSPSIDATCDALVTRGDYSVSVQPSSYVISPEKPTKISVRVADVEKSSSPISDIPVKIEFAKPSDDPKNENTPIATVEARTDAKGIATVDSPLGLKDSIVVTARVTDQANHKINGNCYVYAERGSFGDRNQERLEVVMDKRQYNDGDTAVALITCPDPGGFAWVTTEGDKLISSQLIELREKTTRVQVPVTRAHFPCSFFSVTYIRSKQYYESTKTISLARTPRKLTVEVTPDEKQVLPGKTVSVTIRTLDASGHGVSADTSVAVVDESLFALQEDNTNLVKEFYPSRRNLVRTSYSFPEIYLDGGDKGASSVAVRSRFLDTAWWNPSVQTDASGVAHCEVPLPDNLTDWRITVEGATDSTQVGKGVAHVIAKKPLMVRAALPRFMVKGDRQEISVSVVNASGANQRMKFLVRSHGIKIESDVPSSVSVDDGKSQQVLLTIVAEETGEAWLTVQALADSGASDGVKETMPVYSRGRKEHAEESLVVDGHASYKVGIPATADKNTTSLKVSFAPTVASSLLASVDSLVNYPYGCVEQTMSRFLPAVLVGKLLRDNGIRRPELEAKIPEVARDSVARLAKMQHSDGAWGWWENDDSSVELTALVLDGLKRAQAAGVETNIKTDQALEWLHTALTAKAEKTDNRRYADYAPSYEERAYGAYVLARYDEADKARQVLATFKFNMATPTGIAYCALAYDALGDGASRDRALALLTKMADHASGLTAWREVGFWDSTSSQPTAISFLAMLHGNTSSDVLADIARSLVALRKGSLWETTRATSYSIISLSEYLGRTHELLADRAVTIRVNGKQVAQQAWTAGSVGSGTVTLAGNDLATGQNTVEVDSTGGKVYVQIDAKYVDVGAEEKTVGTKDLTVDRTYRRLEPQALADGTHRLLPSKRVVSEVRVGDIVQVEISVNSSGPIDYLMVEDPIPSNFKIVERDSIEEGGRWSYLWDGIQMFDDHIALFMTHLVPSHGVIRYTMRAEAPGEATALPTRVEPMYAPSRSVSAAASKLVVKP